MGKQSRDKSREMRRAKAAMAEQRRGRRRWAFTAGMVIVVALLMAIVGSLIWAAGNDDDSTGTASGELVTPKGATAAGALVSGESGAVRLEIYLDYMCPYCGRFERANGDEIERLVADGTVRLELHPLSFLDRMSDGTQYSTRAANAVATVADRAPDQLLRVQRGAVRQPAAGGQQGPDRRPDRRPWPAGSACRPTVVGRVRRPDLRAVGGGVDGEGVRLGGSPALRP